MSWFNMCKKVWQKTQWNEVLLPQIVHPLLLFFLNILALGLISYSVILRLMARGPKYSFLLLIVAVFTVVTESKLSSSYPQKYNFLLCRFTLTVLFEKWSFFWNYCNYCSSWCSSENWSSKSWVLCEIETQIVRSYIFHAFMMLHPMRCWISPSLSRLKIVYIF